MSTMPASDPRFCACCVPAAPRAPSLVHNRPGLLALDWRIGTFATFRQAMLDAIVAESALAGLATRESDDYAVTLLELFAAVGDVLTFYTERIANERYLRTARERDSLRRLVRLIGYRLRPGLATTALLTFTLDDGNTTRIRKGLKVMSIPGQDERPQTFETIEEMVADARLNALPIFAPPILLNAFAQGRAAGPLVARPDPLAPGARLVLFGGPVLEEKTVDGIDRTPGGERLRFAPGVLAAELWSGVARMARVVRRLRFFGHDAPPTHQRYDANPAVPPQHRWTTQTIPGDFAAGLTRYPLDARYDDLEAGTQLLVDAGATAIPRYRTATVTEVDDGAETLGPLAATVTRATLRRTILGRPAVAMRPAGGVHVVARDGAGTVLSLDPATGWHWQVRGGIVASEDPVAVASTPTRIEAFVRDEQRRLRHAAWTTGSGWSAWSDRGGVLTSRPAAITAVGGEVLVFARGLDQALWVIRMAGGAVAPWATLGGVLTSGPAAVSWGGGRVDVFARGLDRALWWKTRNGGAWSSWRSLGGTLAGAPVVASTGAGRLDVVALDAAGGLVHRGFAGGAWSDWRTLGGRAPDEPAAQPAIVASGPDRVDVFVHQRDGKGDGALAHIARAGATWSAWTTLDGAVGSSPALVPIGGWLVLMARGADGALVGRVLMGAVWGPWVPLGDGLGAIADRRQTRIFEIARPDVTFRAYDYPTPVAGGRVAIRLDLAPGLETLDAGRRLLVDGGGVPHSARVTRARPIASVPGEAPDHLLVDFAPPLPAPLDAPTLRGNVAASSHGETQPEEPLGHGDATRTFQRFRLSRSPLTYLPRATALAGTAELEVRVNRERWHEVPSLYARGPTERVYTLGQTDDGETLVTFGDGVTGARLPSGALNVVARYRTGLGLAGRMRAGQLETPLERPVGLRAVTNPLPADGGADPEPRDDARAAAPTTVRTFGRAIALADFEALATSSGLVARAYATWVWHRLEKAVHLTVAAAGGAAFSADALATLHAALTTARDPNRLLLLAGLVRVPLVVRAKLLRHPDFEADAVLSAARTALLSSFDFAHMPLGRAVHASDVYAVLQGATGVVALDLDVFHLKGWPTLTPVERAVRAVTADPVQPHVRIFPARPTPTDPSQIDRYARAGFTGPVPPPVLAAEQAYIEDATADVALTVVEAL